MNLEELLKAYKTTPSEEIAKIKKLFERKECWRMHTYTILEMFDKDFLHSSYSQYETSFARFYENIVFNGNYFEGMGVEEIEFSKYRMFCELIENLLEMDFEDTKIHRDLLSSDIQQLKSIIEKGLFSCGYKLTKKNDVYVTERIDPVAEAVSLVDKTYQEDIIDYLSSKTIKEKEASLTSLSIKLEAMEASNNYVKQNKKYVQLLRHKEEKMKEPNYSWFFAQNEYNENLEKLFKIFLFMISYNDCSTYLNEFDSKVGGKKQ